jgi:hypothetical protein
MKTFQEFCEDTYQLNEFRVGNPLNNPLVKKVTQNPVVKKVAGGALRADSAATAINPKETLMNRVTGALGAVKPFSPVTIGVGLGSQVLAPAAINLAKQREQARQKRLYSLVPSGKTDVSGKPAQIRPLNK